MVAFAQIGQGSAKARRDAARWPSILHVMKTSGPPALWRFLHVPLNRIVPPPFSQVAMSSVQSAPLEVCCLAQHPPHGVAPPDVSPSGCDLAKAGHWLLSYSHDHFVPRRDLCPVPELSCPSRGPSGVFRIAFGPTWPPVGQAARQSQLQRMHGHRRCMR